MPEVVDIFVRVNSGGQKLAASDLMLSIASGTQGDVDIHLKMNDAINLIDSSVKDQETGFKTDKEFILTAGLYFTGAKSLSLKKKENYTSEKMDEIFLDKWDRIVSALSNTVQYIEHIGFSGKKLTSKNLILPVAYYFYINKLKDNHKNSSSNRACCDAIFIRQWMLRAMINGLFQEGTGATLLKLREIIDQNMMEEYFPLDELFKTKFKKPLTIENDKIDDLCNLKYGDVRVLPLLMDLASFSPDVYQVDHIWPKDSLLTAKAVRTYYPSATDAEVDKFKNNCHKLANLELLRPLKNQQKSNTLYETWIKNENPDTNYYKEQCIPRIKYYYKNFPKFISEREKILKDRIKDAFPDSFSEIVTRYGLENKI